MCRPDYIFTKRDVPAVLENQLKQLREAVSQIGASSLGPGQFTATEAQVLAKFTIEPLEIDWNRESVSKEEVVEERPSDFGRGRTFKRQEVVLRIKVPFTGDQALFKFSPTSFPNLFPRAEVNRNELELVYQAAQHELEKLKREHDSNVAVIQSNVTKINELLADYHVKLPGVVRQLLEARRDQLNVVDTKLAELGFNLHRRPEPPPVTFPVTRKQIIRPLPPTAKTATALPHRVLENRDYDEVLGFLAGMSIAIERSPSTFADIGEEPLRDWFLVALNGTFQGDATSETFNREGKTDIAVRVDGNVIFIAECKFWSGEKVLLATLDQLLGYLTWRDSKAGILLFVRNADFTAVLRQIQEVVARHPKFVRHLAYSSETGFRFALKNKTDAGREHIVTLLAFHVPRVA